MISPSTSVFSEYDDEPLPYMMNPCFCDQCAMFSDICNICDKCHRRPDVICGNPDCGNSYHEKCLADWLRPNAIFKICSDIYTKQYSCSLSNNVKRFQWLSECKQEELEGMPTEWRYDACQCGDVEYKIGDFVAVRESGTEAVAKIINLFRNKQGEAKVHIEWYWDPTELLGHCENQDIAIDEDEDDDWHHREVILSPKYREDKYITDLRGRVYVVHSLIEADYDRIYQQWKPPRKQWRKILKKRVPIRVSKEKSVLKGFATPHSDFFQHSNLHARLTTAPNRNQWRWYRNVYWCRRQWSVKKNELSELAFEYWDTTNPQPIPGPSIFVDNTLQRSKSEANSPTQSRKKKKNDASEDKPHSAPQSTTNRRPPRLDISEFTDDESDDNDDADRPLSSTAHPALRRREALAKRANKNINKSSRKTTQKMRRNNTHKSSDSNTHKSGNNSTHKIKAETVHKSNRNSKPAAPTSKPLRKRKLPIAPTDAPPPKRVKVEIPLDSSGRRATTDPRMARRRRSNVKAEPQSNGTNDESATNSISQLWVSPPNPQTIPTTQPKITIVEDTSDEESY